MSGRAYQTKAGVKQQSTRLGSGGHNQLKLALRMWELKEEFPQVIPWRQQIDNGHREHQAKQRRAS